MINIILANNISSNLLIQKPTKNNLIALLNVVVNILSCNKLKTYFNETIDYNRTIINYDYNTNKFYINTSLLYIPFNQYFASNKIIPSIIRTLSKENNIMVITSNDVQMPVNISYKTQIISKIAHMLPNNFIPILLMLMPDLESELQTNSLFPTTTEYIYFIHDMKIAINILSIFNNNIDLFSNDRNLSNKDQLYSLFYSNNLHNIYSEKFIISNIKMLIFGMIIITIKSIIYDLYTISTK